MHVKHSLKSIIRSFRKTILFILLLSLAAGVVAIGTSMYQESTQMKASLDEFYHTVATIVYQGQSEENPVLFFEEMNEKLKSFPFDEIEQLDTVREVGFESTALAFVQGSDVKKVGSALKDWGVLTIGGGKNLDVFISQAIIQEIHFGAKFRENNTLRISYMDEHSTYVNADIKENRTYLLIGRRVASNTPAILLYPSVPDEVANLPSIIDITDNLNFLQTEEGKEIRTLLDDFQVVNSSYQVKVLSSLYTNEDFLSGRMKLEAGTYLKSSSKEILISDVMAKDLEVGIGDSISLNLHFSSSGLGISDYLKTHTFSHQSSYTVAGIFQKQDGMDIDIYMNQEDWMNQQYHDKTFVKYLIQNGKEEAFRKEVEPFLFSNMTLQIADQGYEEAIKPVKQLQTSATLIVIVGYLIFLLMLILFSYLYMGKQKETIRIMRALGTKISGTMVYLGVSTALIILVSIVIGTISGYFLQETINSTLFQLFSTTMAKDIRYSIREVGLKEIKPLIDTVSLGSFTIPALFQVSISFLVLSIGAIRTVGTVDLIRQPVMKKNTVRKVKHHQKHIHLDWIGIQSLRFAGISIIRNGVRSFIVPIITCALSFLFVILFLLGTIQKEKLKAAYEQIPVTAYLSNYDGTYRSLSNLNLGYDVYRLIDPTYEKRLEWDSEMYEYYMEYGNYTGQQARKEQGELLLQSEFIKELYLSTSCHYEFVGKIQTGNKEYQLITPEIRIHNNAFGFDWFLEEIKRMPFITFTNHIQYTADFFDEEEVQVSYLKGFDERTLQESTEDVALVSNSFANQNQIGLGDFIQVNSWYVYDETTYVAMLPLQVVGIYQDPYEMDTIFVPYLNTYEQQYINDQAIVSGEWSKEFYQDVAIWNEFIPRNPQTVTWLMKNTENLDLFRDYLQLHGYSRNQSIGQIRSSVVLEDDLLLNTVVNIEKFIQTTNLIKPVMMLFAICSGFFVSYILLKHRIEEIAIMRSVGTSKIAVVISFYSEQLLLLSLGVIPVMIWLLMSKQYLRLDADFMFAFLIFIGAYLAGTMASLWIMISYPVRDILFTKE